MKWYKIIPFSVIFASIMLAGCAHKTRLGISYTTESLGALDISKINPAQIDAAWLLSAGLWGEGDPTQVTIIFWDKPISYAQERYAGATWGTQINVYVRPGDESCLFLPTNSGTLVHEMGHALLFMHGDTAGDLEHKDPRWRPDSDMNRTLLHATFCVQLVAQVP